MRVENYHYIRCQLCGKEFGQITGSHLSKHNLSREQYTELFPNSLLICGKSAEERSRKITESKIGKPAPNKGKPATEEQKRKQSETMKLKYANGHVHSRTGVKLSPTTKNKISKSLTGRSFWNDDIHQKRNETISNKVKNGWVSPLKYRKLSEGHRLKSITGLQIANKNKTEISIKNLKSKCNANNLLLLTSDFEEYNTKTFNVDLRCNICLHSFSFNRQMFDDCRGGGKELCPKCYPRMQTISGTELEIASFVKSLITHNGAVCKLCGRHTNWSKKHKRYNTYCSVKCSANDPELKLIKAKTNIERYGCANPSSNSAVREKVKNTNLERYGVPCSLQNETVKNKSKETNLERYGVENPFSNEIIKEKIKQTNLEKYGVEHYSQTDEYSDKIKETNLEKYGTEYYYQSDDFKEKCKNTLIDRYGVEYVSQSEDIRDKIKQTNLERYGVEFPSQAAQFKQKAIETNNSRYGVDYLVQQHISEETYEKLEDKDWLIDQHHNKHNSLTDISKMLNVSPSMICQTFYKHDITIQNFYFESGEELAVKELFSEYETLTNTRSIIPPKELDIYVPELTLAIEYDGIIWHSETFGKKDKNYHLDKTELCENKGIRLIHIFSNEWKDKQEIVKSNILNILDKSIKIESSYCEIVEISKYKADKFLETNHIQGSSTSYLRYGLTYDNQLVSTMTFGKPINNQYELLRFGNTLNHNIVDGSVRLLNHFIKEHNPKDIITYSDRRWENGDLHEQLGFKFVHNVEPNYYYFHRNSTDNLLSNKELEKLKITFDSNLSEWDNMKNNGYDRIYDCGSTKWILNIK